MNLALTQTELNALDCGTPGCTADHSVIYLHCDQCEVEDLAVCYDKPHGEMVVECNGLRERTDARIAVKPAHP